MVWKGTAKTHLLTNVRSGLYAITPVISALTIS